MMNIDTFISPTHINIKSSSWFSCLGIMFGLPLSTCFLVDKFTILSIGDSTSAFVDKEGKIIIFLIRLTFFKAWCTFKLKVLTIMNWSSHKIKYIWSTWSNICCYLWRTRHTCVLLILTLLWLWLYKSRTCRASSETN